MQCSYFRDNLKWRMNTLPKTGGCLMPHCVGVSMFQSWLKSGAWRLVTHESCSGCCVAIALWSVYREKVRFGCSRYKKTVSLKFDATAPDCQTMAT